jgi:MSHA biogenesis protein MshK
MKLRLEIAIYCCATAMSAVAYAESLADPTRPPAAFGSPGAEEAAEGVSALQSIIRRNGSKPGAIINGEYVLLGGRVGEARLVKIGEDSVTLKSPTGTETLTLTTGVEKTPAGGATQEGGGKMRKDRNEGKK